MNDSPDGADKKDVGGGGEELLTKLTKLESTLEEIERTRKQRTLISVGGLILILIAIALFASNLWNFGKQQFSEDNQKVLMETVQEDLGDILKNDPELRKLMEELEKDVLPHVSKEISERFQKELPEFQKQGEKILSNLQNYVEKDAKEKLANTLAEFLAEIEQEMLKRYPTVTPEELQAVIKKSQSIFVEEITNVMEKKLSVVAGDLGNLKMSIDKFKDLPEAKKIDVENMEKVKLEMIEAMLELVIYHINPERGKLPSIPLEGGVK